MVIQNMEMIKKEGKNLETIIIDEVSMLRADLLDCIDKFLRLNGPIPKLPFGGVQMLFIGDLMQLPPVVTKEEEFLFKNYYDSPYFFSAKCMNEVFCHIIEFQKVYRQTDERFINILNSIRTNNVDSRIIDSLNKRIGFLNEVISRFISICFISICYFSYRIFHNTLCMWS